MWWIYALLSAFLQDLQRYLQKSALHSWTVIWQPLYEQALCFC